MPPSREKQFVVVVRWSIPRKDARFAYHGPGTADEAQSWAERLKLEPVPAGVLGREIGVAELVGF